MKNAYLSLFTFVFIFIVSFTVLLPVREILQLEDGLLASYEDVETINQTHKFGSFINSQMEEKETIVGGEKQKQGEIVFKLFGIIPIKRVEVTLTDDDVYYVGGVPIGLLINADGAIVVGENSSTLKEGDIITKINGEKVESLDQIEELLNDSSGELSEEAEVEYLRKNKTYKTLIKTTRDDKGMLKLGLWVKDDVTGVGTLTFVNTKNLSFGALGHSIIEVNGGNAVPVSSGKVFECNLIGIEKGKKNDPGELKCVFVSTSGGKGVIESNTKYGVKGVLSDVSNLVDENVTAKLGGRLGVKMGKAKIVSTISGIREEYDIEIIKTSNQKTANDKSIVFRVTDKRLLDLSGGIVQGMSGSPIMQDGKIIGAVTHVFLNDPSKGYGVYVDWML